MTESLLVGHPGHSKLFRELEVECATRFSRRPLPTSLYEEVKMMIGKKIERFISSIKIKKGLEQSFKSSKIAFAAPNLHRAQV